MDGYVSKEEFDNYFHNIPDTKPSDDAIRTAEKELLKNELGVGVDQKMKDIVAKIAIDELTIGRL